MLCALIIRTAATATVAAAQTAPMTIAAVLPELCTVRLCRSPFPDGSGGSDEAAGDRSDEAAAVLSASGAYVAGAGSILTVCVNSPSPYDIIVLIIIHIVKPLLT